MFFPEMVTQIKDHYRVLEIGPGALPHPRADVALELDYASEEERIRQRGESTQKVDTSNIVYFNGGRFPFDDMQFDYVICSHVLEHIPPEGLDEFLSELQRVAPRGYVEVPNVFYEWICNASAHIWAAGWNNGTLTLCLKNDTMNGPIADAYRHFFYTTEPRLIELFRKYRDFFFIGFEWEETVTVAVVDHVNDLCDGPYLERMKSVRANPEALPPPVYKAALRCTKRGVAWTIQKLLGDGSLQRIKQILKVGRH
ncbi:class I SAM-dependent methyltransferase [cf. Phormidesmis sp. LEGE 11477]|uniref:class I SAM-dependent methyltransferase n=1 Tax=cf. Phormidesmis sp. LEGE 11477 TaxID=1828680 RepID=UPI00187DE577|nr:class I SAM-dependent methyltransferase [cf. Phormidesmis sp. LEGE 11477]MBE9064947.1 class I SAM-dependent methyltransferase [cf. Phormidesmis sp. LEGE 11477]